MGLVEKKIFATLAIDLDHRTFMIYIVLLGSSNIKIDIYPFYKLWIIFLIITKAYIVVFSECVDFADIFFGFSN